MKVAGGCGVKSSGKTISKKRTLQDQRGRGHLCNVMKYIVDLRLFNDPFRKYLPKTFNESHESFAKNNFVLISSV